MIRSRAASSPIFRRAWGTKCSFKGKGGRHAPPAPAPFPWDPPGAARGRRGTFKWGRPAGEGRRRSTPARRTARGRVSAIPCPVSSHRARKKVCAIYHGLLLDVSSPPARRKVRSLPYGILLRGFAAFERMGPHRTLTRGVTWSGCRRNRKGPAHYPHLVPARRIACAPSASRTFRTREPPLPLPRRGGRRRRSGVRIPRTGTRRWASLPPYYFLGVMFDKYISRGNPGHDGAHGRKEVAVYGDWKGRLAGFYPLLVAHLRDKSSPFTRRRDQIHLLDPSPSQFGRYQPRVDLSRFTGIPKGYIMIQPGGQSPIPRDPRGRLFPSLQTLLSASGAFFQ